MFSSIFHKNKQKKKTMNQQFAPVSASNVNFVTSPKEAVIVRSACSQFHHVPSLPRLIPSSIFTALPPCGCSISAPPSTQQTIYWTPMILSSINSSRHQASLLCLSNMLLLKQTSYMIALMFPDDN